MHINADRSLCGILEVNLSSPPVFPRVKKALGEWFVQPFSAPHAVSCLKKSLDTRTRVSRSYIEHQLGASAITCEYSTPPPSTSPPLNITPCRCPHPLHPPKITFFQAALPPRAGRFQPKSVTGGRPEAATPAGVYGPSWQPGEARGTLVNVETRPRERAAAQRRAARGWTGRPGGAGRFGRERSVLGAIDGAAVSAAVSWGRGERGVPWCDGRGGGVGW